MDLVNADFPRKPRIYVADDNKLNRELLHMQLTMMGAEVRTATDGEQLVAMAVNDPPDLILTDMQMPRMDGIEATRQLKAHAATQFVPVVMLTAMEGDEEKLKAVQAGVDDFMTKPYSNLILMTRARILLNNKHLHDRLRSRNRLLKQLLNRFVTEEVADEILKDPEHYLQLGGQTRQITVLFADIRGFTTYTERQPAEHVVDTLNFIFNALTEVVFAHRGTFDKYLGDAMMAFFGAPLAAADDPVRAARAALAMHRSFAALQASRPDLQGLGLGIGLNSGEATVGNIGSERVMDYTVIGDTVNVAKRLEESALAGQTLISEATYALIAPHFEAQALDRRRIRGRNEMVDVFALLGERQTAL